MEWNIRFFRSEGMELPEQKYSKYSENYSLKSDKKQSFTHESETSTVSSKCICKELDHFVQTYSSVQPRGHGNLFRHRFSSPPPIKKWARAIFLDMFLIQWKEIVILPVSEMRWKEFCNVDVLSDQGALVWVWIGW